MSIECGYALRVENEGKPTVFRGEVNLGRINGEFYLIPHPQVRNPGKSPEYAVKMKSANGDFATVGNAWVKKMNAGGSFFSVTVDHPFLTEKPVYLSVFPDDEQPKDTPKSKPANYSVRWSRPRAGAGAQDFGGASMGGEAVADDHIPY